MGLAGEWGGIGVLILGYQKSATNPAPLALDREVLARIVSTLQAHFGCVDEALRWLPISGTPV